MCWYALATASASGFLAVFQPVDDIEDVTEDDMKNTTNYYNEK